MSLPYHRGHTAPSSSSSSAAAMSKHRGGNGYPNAGNGRADEVNTTLMEMENNSRWVTTLAYPPLIVLIVLLLVGRVRITSKLA